MSSLPIRPGPHVALIYLVNYLMVVLCKCCVRVVRVGSLAHAACGNVLERKIVSKPGCCPIWRVPKQNTKKSVLSDPRPDF
jgi:hypothetical protein